MDKRIIMLEGDSWRIRTDSGVLSKSEQAEVREYFDVIRMPNRILGGKLTVASGVDRDTISERMEYFYDGRAEVVLYGRNRSS